MIVMTTILAALLLGLLLTILGLRGRRVDDHPLCPKCGFDLTGKPTDSTRCPECGAELSRRRAVAIGHKARRWSLSAVGAGTLLLTTPFLWHDGRAAWKNGDWRRYEPMMLLLREASSVDVTRRTPALGELRDRFDVKSIDDASLARAVNTALAYQGDLAKPWDPAWGDWIENARHAGYVSDAQWRRYAAQGWPGSFKLVLRKRVQRGDSLPYRIEIPGGRVGPDCRFWADLSNVAIVWNGKRIPIQPHSAILLATMDPFWKAMMRAQEFSTDKAIDAARFPDVVIGRQNVHFVGSVRIASQDKGGDPTPIVDDNFDEPVSFELLPRGTISVAPVDNQSLSASIRNSLRISVLPRYKGFSVYVMLQSVPVDIGFDTFLRSGGTEVEGSPTACAAGGSERTRPVGSMYGAGSTVDITFRSNPALAAATVDETQCWQGEIVFKSVPVGFISPRLRARPTQLPPKKQFDSRRQQVPN